MAIIIMDYPTAGTPSNTPTVPDDYNLQNALIELLIKQGLDGSLLTDWDTNNIPKLKQGAYIRHNNNAYIVSDSDYTLSGDDGWIKLSGTSSLTASFQTSTSGFSYDPVRNGIYNASNEQLLPLGVYKKTSDLPILYLNKKSFINTTLVSFIDQTGRFSTGTTNYDAEYDERSYIKNGITVFGDSNFDGDLSVGDDDGNGKLRMFGRFEPINFGNYQSINIGQNQTIYISAGMAFISSMESNSDVSLEVLMPDPSNPTLGTWVTQFGWSGGTVPSNGQNVRLKKLTSGTDTIRVVYF